MSNKRLFLWFGSLLLFVLGCMVMVVVGWQIFYIWRDDLMSQIVATPTPIPHIDRTPIVNPTLASPALTSTPITQTGTPLGTNEKVENGKPSQNVTESALLQADLPARDQRLLAMHLRNHDQDIPEVVCQMAISYQLNDVTTLWVTDNQTPPRQFQVKASLRYITDHSYWWVQEGFSVNAPDLQHSAERFENKTYPTNRAFFGSEWTPGVDGDARLHIFMGDVPGVAGYFAASNSYSKLAEPYSNEREMFFINLKAIHPGNDEFDGVLAHEFQHMIHWHQDRNEDTWVNEGLSELATFINGYGTSNFLSLFLHRPDTQLNSWATEQGDSTVNYGASFLFMAYFLERYGEDMTQAMVANPNNGVAGFNTVLANPTEKRFDDIFADFLVANYLNDPKIEDGAWGYKSLSPSPVMVEKRYTTYPVDEQTTVHQYGADYFELDGKKPVVIDFTGSTSVAVVDNKAHSGRYEWYSHRGDESDTRLTHSFDFSAVSTATLKYWAWYDIEPDWDYGYVEVSVNDGKTWKILETPHTSAANPSGNAYGAGYTGKSGGSGGPIWVEENINLSAYGGQKILLRFEYVTDDAVNHQGWTIDDLSIPEIGFFDEVENGSGDWQAEGFIRIDNILPQKFLVQLIEIGDNVTVQRIALDETNYGQLTVNGLGGSVKKAILIVSGLTPVTSQPASYQLGIRN